MRGRDGARAGLDGGAVEGGVSRGAGARLEVRAGRDRHVRAGEGDAELARERLGAIELRGRGGAKAVIDAVGDDVDAELRPEAGEDVEERHRVRAAAHRGEEARSARDP